MSGGMLSRGALAAVLQSLLMAEWAACRGDRPQTRIGGDVPADWPGNLRILDDDGDADGPSLGADSLDVLRLSSAANEMFHLYETGRERELLGARTVDGWLDAIEENWRAGVTRITFTTSGSTGPPQRCTHEASFLLEEIDGLARLFGGCRRIVSQVPAHHIFGFLFTAMLADRLDVEVVRANGVRGGRACAMRGGDLMIAVPEQWEWLHRSTGRWPTGVEGVTSTAPCPRGLLASLMESGLGGMTEIYGSSETAGVAVRRWPEEDYCWMPQWKPEVNEDGETCLVHVSGVRKELMDRISPRGGDRFVLNGRRDRAVQVGGTNVHPEPIAAMLRALPGVEDVSVRMMRADEGSRLKAFVVPAAGRRGEEVGHELEDWARRNLTVPERPKRWTFGASLPVNAMGKPADW